jgi:TRAP-type C4-dicarboxylate transport system permease small subunit
LGLTNYYALPFIRTAGDTQLPITNIPMTVPYGIIWIALTLMLIEVVIQIITEIKNIANLNKNKISEEGK